MQLSCRSLDIQNKVIASSNILSTKPGWLCRGVAGKDPNENVASYHSDDHNREACEGAVLLNGVTETYCPHHKSSCFGTDQGHS